MPEARGSEHVVPLPSEGVLLSWGICRLREEQSLGEVMRREGSCGDTEQVPAGAQPPHRRTLPFLGVSPELGLDSRRGNLWLAKLPPREALGRGMVRGDPGAGPGSSLLGMQLSPFLTRCTRAWTCWVPGLCASVHSFVQAHNSVLATLGSLTQ